MRSLVVTGIAAIVLMTGAPLVAQQHDEQLDVLETVLVTGEHPGPGLWKISRGDHVMWVLGTYVPLPKGMTWRSKNVEGRIAESQEVLFPGIVDVQVDFGLGFFKTLALIPAALKADNLPDGKTLKEILPSDTYRKWRSLREKYKVRSGADKSRPSFALEMLVSAANRKERLTDGPVIDDIVKAAAKKHKVGIRRLSNATPTVKLDDIKAVLNHLRTLEFPDIGCFTIGLDHVESDIERLKVHANAWAHGDVDTLRTLDGQPRVGSECDDVMDMAMTTGDSPVAQNIRRFAAKHDAAEAEGRIQLETRWIKAARTGLERNHSTFAVLPIWEVVSANGYVSKLKALGYEVEGQ